MQKTKVAFCRLFVEHRVHHESSTTRSEIDPAGDAGADSCDDDALRAALRASHSGSVSGLRSGPGIVRMMLPPRRLAVLNEFALMWAVRDGFPLRYTVFKQYASHIPHEANVEQLFSRAGNLADPNMDPSLLATLTMIGVNKSKQEGVQADCGRHQGHVFQAVLQQGRRGRPADAEEGRWWRRVIHQSHVSLCG